MAIRELTRAEEEIMRVLWQLDRAFCEGCFSGASRVGP